MNTKKFLLSMLTLSATVMLASCGNSNPQSSVHELTAVEKVVREAETLSREELFKKAADELGDKTFHWIATSSRGGKKPTPQNFIAELNRVAGSEKFSVDQIDYQTTVDGQIYTKINAEVDAHSPTFSGALLQDGYQLQTKGIDKGYVNYVPKEWNEKAGVNKSRDGNPFTLQFQFKTWMYNNANKDMVIDNVWDFLKPGLVIDTMNPENENVNMDWLIQLTSDENVAVLKAAWEDPSNSSTLSSADLEAYAKDWGERKYAFLFIDRFIKNAVFADDDGKALNAFTAAPGHAAWIVYSKIQNVQETEQISKKNIVIGALGSEHTDGKTAKMAMKGFGGFMYKHYLMLMPESPLPWTTCAFINFLSTTESGYVNWKSDVGDYPSYGDEINMDRTMNGHGHYETVDDKAKWVVDPTEPNVFPCLNDPSANWWIDSAKSPVETPSYIASVYQAVHSFIMKAISAK